MSASACCIGTSTARRSSTSRCARASRRRSSTSWPRTSATIADPRERVAAAVRHFVESLEAEGWGAIVTTGWAEADVRPALRDILRRRCDQIRSFAAMFLREAMARGELEPGIDIEELSLATAMLMDGVIAHHAENGDRFDADLAQRSVIALLEPVMRS